MLRTHGTPLGMCSSRDSLFQSRTKSIDSFSIGRCSEEMNMEQFQRPEPLDIKCTSSDCQNGLHCFKATRRMAPAERGRCRSCGADLVDWSRVHRRDKADAAYTFAALQFELIRHHH